METRAGQCRRESPSARRPRREGTIGAVALAPADLPGLAALIRHYADGPMDWADASLVWLAEKMGVIDIITIDRADFAVYRNSSGVRTDQGSSLSITHTPLSRTLMSAKLIDLSILHDITTT